MTQEQIKTVILEVLNVDFEHIPADQLKENFAQKISKVIYDADQEIYNSLKDYVDEKFEEIDERLDQLEETVKELKTSGGTTTGGIGRIGTGTIPLIR